MRWSLVLMLVLSSSATVCVCRREDRPALRFATFNIEDFPKDRRQIEGAFREIVEECVRSHDLASPAARQGRS